MKVAYILYPEVIISNKSNGIRSQAETWASLLKEKGIEVDLISNWGNYNWKEYDVIHFFGSGSWAYNVSARLRKINSKLIWSPIIDPPFSFSYKIKMVRDFLHRVTFGLIKSRYIEDSFTFGNFSKILVRSEFEGNFISNVYHIRKDLIKLIPLSYSLSCKPTTCYAKENFCLHISSIYQERKNVIRLIEAAKKKKFHLILAGNKGNEEQFSSIRKAIGNAKNIEVLGFISEEQKLSLYQRAKVFSLPSLAEGVGIVAVDAAYYGCEIVITNISGPKEYYNGHCIEVNPKSIEDIGNAIINFLEGKVQFQPKLSNFIKEEYSPEKVSDRLIKLYLSIQ